LDPKRGGARIVATPGNVSKMATPQTIIVERSDALELEGLDAEIIDGTYFEKEL
jgi:hypothetical protein